jgi:hypothetical protein
MLGGAASDARRVRVEPTLLRLVVTGQRLTAGRWSRFRHGQPTARPLRLRSRSSRARGPRTPSRARLARVLNGSATARLPRSGSGRRAVNPGVRRGQLSVATKSGGFIAIVRDGHEPTAMTRETERTDDSQPGRIDAERYREAAEAALDQLDWVHRLLAPHPEVGHCRRPGTQPVGDPEPARMSESKGAPCRCAPAGSGGAGLIGKRRASLNAKAPRVRGLWCRRRRRVTVIVGG